MLIYYTVPYSILTGPISPDGSNLRNRENLSRTSNPRWFVTVIHSSFVQSLTYSLMSNRYGGAIFIPIFSPFRLTSAVSPT